MKNTSGYNRIYSIELRQPSGKLVASFTDTLDECNSIGNGTATKLNTQVNAYFIDPLNGQRLLIYTYLGNLCVVDAFGNCFNLPPVYNTSTKQEGGQK